MDSAALVGTTLDHYEVTEKIGQGGMGEVYLALDTQLNRKVALKTLPLLFSNDAQRMSRFQREAQVLASLNHPNIGGIFGLVEDDKAKCLVLELVEGDTIEDRLREHPLQAGKLEEDPLFSFGIDQVLDVLNQEFTPFE